MNGRPGTSLLRHPDDQFSLPAGYAPARNANPADQMTRIFQSAVNTISHWWMIGIPLGLALAAVACAYIWYSFEPQYRSSATLLVREKPEYIAFNNDTYSRRFLQTQLQLFRTRTVLSSALEDVADLPELQGSGDPVGWLESRLGVSPVGQSEFIEASFTCGARESAQAIVRAIVHAYLDHVKSDDDLRTRRIIETLETERKARQDVVYEMRSHVRGMTEELSAKDPTLLNAEIRSVARSLKSRLVDMDVEIEVTRAQLSAERAMSPTDVAEFQVQINNAVASSQEVVQLTAIVDGLNERIAEFERRVTGDPNRIDQYQSYLRQLDTTHAQLARTEERLRERMTESLKSDAELRQQTLLRQLESKVGSLESKRGILEKQMAKSSIEQEQSGGEAVELEFQRQELDRHESVLERISSRIVALRTELGAPGRISLQDDANLPMGPVEQLPWKKLGMAVFMALAAPFGLLFLWEQALQRVGDAESLKEANIRVVGEVATLPKGGRGTLARKTPSLFEESVDTLRVGLKYSRELQDAQVIALTSAVSGEGKTCLSSQLAVSMARASHERTLIIDADIRSPDVADIFDLNNSTGLTDVLSQKAQLEEVIHSIDGVTLDVLPAGPPPKYLQELIGRGAFHDLIEQLRNKYRYIVIDTPPLLAASESVVFATTADATLLCTMRNHSRGRQVSQAYERLLDAGANPVGVVLNGVAVSYYTRRYGYYNYS